MSKAFTKESDGADAPAVLPRRSPLPADTPNYVTARGLALLKAELVALEEERAALPAGDDAGQRSARLRLGARTADLVARIASAVPLRPPALGEGQVQFGAWVRVRAEDGVERSYQVVGVDEADPRHGRIAFISPLARALLGRRVGDCVQFRSPRGSEELEIVAVDGDRESPPEADP